MRIRLLIIATFFIISGSIFYAAYLYFQPTPAPLVLVDYARSISFDYDDVNQYIISRDGMHYLWFCDGDVDCKFVNDNMLRPLAAQVRSDDFPELIFVDMTNVRSDISPARLNIDWGFTSYPAFVAVEVAEGQKTIVNTLMWTPRAPFGRDDIRQWMIDNEIWKGPID
jgi:hypothetical protein